MPYETSIQILRDILAIRDRQLQRGEDLNARCPGAISEDAIDELRISVLQAKLVLVKEVGPTMGGNCE